MKTLVTGATGFLGKATVQRLEADGYDVTATGRRKSDGIVECDLADPEALWRMLEDVAPAAVVNCAAEVDFSAASLPRQYAVNVLAPGVIAGWAAARGAHLVHASTILVHGIRTRRIGPNSPLKPDSDYGRAKLLAEQLIEASGCKHTLLRFCGLYGTGGPSHLGLNRAIDLARDGTPPVLVGKGKALRNYLYVDDASTMIVHCLKTELVGTHLAAGSESLRFADMLHLICTRFLADRAPERRDGSEAEDQVVELSPGLPGTRPMAQVLAEMP